MGLIERWTEPEGGLRWIGRWILRGPAKVLLRGTAASDGADQCTADERPPWMGERKKILDLKIDRIGHVPYTSINAKSARTTMFSDADAAPPSPAATATDNDGVGALTTWQPIFHASNQVVLYNPTSHAIAIRASSIQPHERHCPYCKQTVPPAFHPEPEIHDNDFDDDYAQSHSRASNYFHLLAIANDTWSRPSTPPSPIEPGDNAEAGPSTFSRDSLAHGYFKTFFTEEQKLGMGANGSVYLCQVNYSLCF